MSVVTIARYAASYLSLFTVLSNPPAGNTDFAVTGNDSAAMGYEHPEAVGNSAVLVVDTGKSKPQDSIVVRDIGSQWSDSLQQEERREKRKAAYGFLVIAAIGLFWAGVLAFLSGFGGSN